MLTPLRTVHENYSEHRLRWRIQDFPGGGNNPKEGCANLLFGKHFAENCIKMKEIRPRKDTSSWGLLWIRYWVDSDQKYTIQSSFLCKTSQSVDFAAVVDLVAPSPSLNNFFSISCFFFEEIGKNRVGAIPKRVNLFFRNLHFGQKGSGWSKVHQRASPIPEGVADLLSGQYEWKWKYI